MDTRKTNILAYITFIGWMIAYFCGDRERCKFHLNQGLVLILGFFLLGLLPNWGFLFNIVRSCCSLFLFFMWVGGLADACRGLERPLPLIGEIKLLK